MNNFTEVYKATRNVVSTETFADDWHTFLTRKCNIRQLVGDEGFSSGRHRDLGKIRARIKKESTATKNSGEVIFDAATVASRPDTLNKRAASLKMLKHVYRLTRLGSQSVWVYSPPKAYGTWIFDEITGNAIAVKAKLALDDEIFGMDEMKWMRSALAVANKIVNDTRAKLARGSRQTKKIVARWFLDKADDDAAMEATLSALKAGFLKISVACKSKTLVFTDYADWRATRDKYYGAAFRGGEGGGFPVIYLEGAFTRLTGNSGKQWLCAQTIIHELSHHEVSTEDHRYDHHGLKPTDGFGQDKTIANADSWGYFALDLAGYLSKADRENVWK